MLARTDSRARALVLFLLVAVAATAIGVRLVWWQVVQQPHLAEMALHQLAQHEDLPAECRNDHLLQIQATERPFHPPEGLWSRHLKMKTQPLSPCFDAARRGTGGLSRDRRALSSGHRGWARATDERAVLDIRAVLDSSEPGPAQLRAALSHALVSKAWTTLANDVGVFGTPEDCVQGLAEIASVGVDMIMLNPLYDYTRESLTRQGALSPQLFGNTELSRLLETHRAQQSQLQVLGFLLSAESFAELCREALQNC